MPKRFETDELIYKGRTSEVHKVTLRMPDGHVVQRDFFHYPGAAVVLPVLDDGSIILIRNYRFAVQEHLYELCAGVIDPGETPAVCAERELLEETGYTAGRIEPLSEFYTGPGTTDDKMYSYLATGLTKGKQALEDYEEITVEVHPDADVRRMVRDGTIHDAKTIVALALYWMRNGN